MRIWARFGAPGAELNSCTRFGVAVALGMVDETNDDESRAEHADKLARAPSPRTNFDAALLCFLMLKPRDGRDGKRDGRRKAMLEALDGLATWSQIRGWRRGEARPPQWAKDLLADKIAKRRQLLASGESQARAA